MEKLIEKYTMDKVFEVIEKHKAYHMKMVADAKLKKELLEFVLDESDEAIKECIDEMDSSASAIATLSLLEKELRGEVEY